MLLPFQTVPKIHAWKEGDVIFLMKSTSKDVNGQKHAKTWDKDKNQKANLLLKLNQGDEERDEDKSFKISKVALGQTSLVCVSEVDAMDENDNEIKLSIRKEFTDDKKKEKYYRYTLPRLTCSMIVRQARSVLLVTKDEEDCVKDTTWLTSIKQVISQGQKSPTKVNWSLPKSTAFLHRFCDLVYDTLDDEEDRTVVTFTKSEKKREIEVQVEEDFNCDELTSGDK